MSKYTYTELLLANLAGKIPKNHREYQPKEEAYKRLQAKTGEDFGYDAEKWRTYLENRSKQVLEQQAHKNPPE